VPIGALFALSLWASNAAYLHLSVSFLQMIKARARARARTHRAASPRSGAARPSARTHSPARHPPARPPSRPPRPARAPPRPRCPLQALMPLLVYLIGAAAGLERLERASLLNMAAVVAGVAAASYGRRAPSSAPGHRRRAPAGLAAVSAALGMGGGCPSAQKHCDSGQR
jgi:hypothetical protein